jgi:hypothetical protein
LGVELDVLRIGKVYVGPAAGYCLNNNGWVGIGGGYNIFKNVDIGGYGGIAVRDKGYNCWVSVGFAIE